MGKKKFEEQREKYLAEILELLKINERAAITQSSYKRDFFKVFSHAYRAGFCIPGSRFDEELRVNVQCKLQRPLVRGDAIWAYAKKQGWVHSEMESDEKRYKQIALVQTWWDEWTYAWSHHPNPAPRHYLRKK